MYLLKVVSHRVAFCRFSDSTCKMKIPCRSGLILPMSLSAFIQGVLYGNLSFLASIHGPRNPLVGLGKIPISATASDLQANFLLSVTTNVCTTGIDVLISKECGGLYHAIP